MQKKVVQHFIQCICVYIVLIENAETFLLWSSGVPSRALGMLDAHAQVLELTIAGRDLTIHQNPALLQSNLATGTTGAVIWDVTPVFAEWIATSSNVLFKNSILGPDTTVLELGSGIGGVIGLMLAPLIKHFVFTDQEYVLKILRQNIEENTIVSREQRAPKSKKSKSLKHQSSEAVPSKIEVLALDWETSALEQLPHVLNTDGSSGGIDVVLAVDCVFNENIVEPLVQTCRTLSHFRHADSTRPTVCVFAQQLRQPDVFEQWLRTVLRDFSVWRIPDEMLSAGLKERSGFVVHLAVLKHA